jgi:RNA polymerase sigma-70 factor (ECF subfamily)
MPARNLHVLHLLLPRRVGGQTQVFLHAHPNWRQTPGGRPLFALPATGLPDGGDAVPARIRHVFRDDLKLPEQPREWRAFEEVEAHTVSPAKGVPGAYRIRPVVARLPAVAHGRAAKHAAGVWLTPHAALARPDLSPTARAVLQGVAPADLLPPLSPEDLEAGGNRGVAARLAAARDGDMAQFAAVVRQLEPVFADRLRHAADTRALARRPHDLEDALANGFAAALRNLERFDPSGNATGWLWTIAFHAAVDVLRRTGRAGPLPAEAADPRADMSDPTAGLEADEERAARRARLADAVAQVDPLARRAWELRAAGAPYKAIAARLGVPQGTVATWVSRIRKLAAGER